MAVVPWALLAALGLSAVVSFIAARAARPYIDADPCMSGWDVPWGVPLNAAIIAITAGLVLSIIVFAVVDVVSRQGMPARLLAAFRSLAAIPLMIILGFATLLLANAPFGWRCPL